MSLQEKEEITKFIKQISKISYKTVLTDFFSGL